AADAYEPDDAVGPHQVTVERVLTREELPRDAAADDHDALGAVAVSVVEVAAGDYRDAEGRKEARRHRAGARVWVVRRILVPGAFDGEREAAAGAARVAPRHRAAERDLLDARHLAQAAPNLSRLASSVRSRARTEKRAAYRASTATIGCAIATPSSAPLPQSSTLSASSVRRSVDALAPSAARTASSDSRRTLRARIRFATFEQAMTNTSADAASRTSSTVLALAVI